MKVVDASAMKKTSVMRMVIVIGSTAALFFAVYSLQYFQSRFGQESLTISPETSISIVAQMQNLTNYNMSDYSVNYVLVKGNGEVFNTDPTSKSVGERIGMAAPTITGGNHFAWEVKSKRGNSTYYVDSTSGSIVSRSP